MDSRCICWLDEGTCVWVQTPGREQHSSLCWSTKMTPPFHIKSVCRLSVCVKVCVWVQASGLKGVMAVRVKVTCTCVGWLKVDRQPWTETFAANEVTSGVFPHSSTTLYNTNERERDRQLWREGGREGVRQREGDRMPAEKRCDTQWDKKTAAGSKWQTW